MTVRAPKLPPENKRTKPPVHRQSEGKTTSDIQPDPVIQLQRTIGNQATLQLLRDNPARVNLSQPSKRMIQPDRTYNQLDESQRIQATRLRLSLTKKIASERYKANNELLIKDEETLIRALSQTDTGSAWLTHNGFLPEDEVIAYHKARNFIDWQKKSALHRLQIAHYQYTHKKKKTPGYWKGLSVYGMTDKIYDMDEAALSKTMSVPGRKDDVWNDSPMTRRQLTNALDIFKRILLVLQVGLKFSDKDEDWAEDSLKEWTENVASALSHGGRVNVRIPQVDSKKNTHEFVDWLMGDGVRNNKKKQQASGVTTRASSTHNVKIGKNQKDKDGNRQKGTGSFKETSSSTGYFKGITHFGINLPVGGIGQKDINGDAILPDGRYGHLYIGYVPPSTEKDGALLIGLESDSHGAPGASPIGHEHTMSAVQSEFSPTGGHKSDKAHSYAKVDLTALHDDWLNNLKEVEDELEEGYATSQDLLGKKIIEHNDA